MSEKNMSRKFKVGDKVVFTKEAIDSGMFHKSIQVGDFAVVKSVKSCVGGSFPTEVLPERDGLWIQRVDMDYEPEVYEWFEYVDTKKEYKKKRKYFRMGDFVTLKDGTCLEECSIFGDIAHSTIGIICGMGHDGAVEVHFTTVTGYNFDRVYPEALRLATKEERKTLRKHKVAKITYDDLVTEEIEQDIEVAEAKIPPEYDVKVGDIVEPATEEEKMIMRDDEIVSHAGSIYHVIDIDVNDPSLMYYVLVDKECAWFSDNELVKNYAKLLENGRVYEWATDLTFANIETWVNSKNKF